MPSTWLIVGLLFVVTGFLLKHLKIDEWFPALEHEKEQEEWEQKILMLAEEQLEEERRTKNKSRFSDDMCKFLRDAAEEFRQLGNEPDKGSGEQ